MYHKNQNTLFENSYTSCCTTHTRTRTFRLVGTILASALDSPEEAVVGRFLLVVLIPHKRGTFTFEDAWDPGILVRDAPYR